jgi:hypothetical protein
MIETNIRIVKYGANLRLKVRVVEVKGNDFSADLMQKACNAIRRRYGWAAVIGQDKKTLFVATQKRVPDMLLEGDNWRLELNDSGQSRTLHFKSITDRDLLAQIFERQLIAEIERKTKMWSLDSLRIWYEAVPSLSKDGILVWHRYEISGIAIDKVGIGLIVDVGTAFFSVATVADYFCNNITDQEKKARQNQFQRLTARQQGQKGTLVYETSKGRTVCYFDSWAEGMTASTTGTIPVKGKTYSSLQDYYAQTLGIQVDNDELVAKVSFPGIDRPVPVIARGLKIRIMNDSLPVSLKQADKIEPQKRCNLIEKFWKLMGDLPLGDYFPDLNQGFWQPTREKIFQAKYPDLIFGNGMILRSPNSGNVNEITHWFRERLNYLDLYGCYRISPTLVRTLYIAIPSSFGDEVANELAKAIVKRLSKWTRKEITPVVISYENYREAMLRLKKGYTPGVVLFIFDQEDPATYFDLSYELDGWRVKRITSAQLSRRASQFEFAKDARRNSEAVITRFPKGWDGFVEMNALDLLQQMDCIPFAPAGRLHYEAHLAIDVGAHRRYFALSLLIHRPGTSGPVFRLETKALIKGDSKKETINERILRDEIVKLCQLAENAGFKNLKSLLVLRDGRECGKELTGIFDAKAPLEGSGFLSTNAAIDIIDFHKNSVKGIRLWNRSKGGEIQQILEGDGIIIDGCTVILANTGAATLRQGTAEPVMLVGRIDNLNMFRVAENVHTSSQLNWSSPSVAQRLPIELKRTDDELKNRAAQEIRRIK